MSRSSKPSKPYDASMTNGQTPVSGKAAANRDQRLATSLTGAEEAQMTGSSPRDPPSGSGA